VVAVPGKAQTFAVYIYIYRKRERERDSHKSNPSPSPNEDGINLNGVVQHDNGMSDDDSAGRPPKQGKHRIGFAREAGPPF